MASQYSLNAEHHLHSIAQLPTLNQKLDVIVKAMNEIILAVQKLELQFPS